MIKVIINSSRKPAEVIGDFLTERGALAVSLQDAGDQPLFQEALNEMPLWAQTQIHALFDDGADANEIMQQLAAVLNAPVNYHIEPVIEEDWVQKTQHGFPAQCFAERLWIVPAWEQSHHYPNIVLRINPGLGFGTGTHPTTALCLTWLAQQDLAGKTVIDYGCGSGILGLAALVLGAKQVWAVDYDPQALIATQNNAELNHFAKEALQVVLPEQLPDIQADVVLANILANPLCELAERLMQCLKPGGQLVLSGFLVEELERVSSAYRSSLQIIEIATQEKWVRLITTLDSQNSAQK